MSSVKQIYHRMMNIEALHIYDGIKIAILHIHNYKDFIIIIAIPDH